MRVVWWEEGGDWSCQGGSGVDVGDGDCAKLVFSRAVVGEGEGERVEGVGVCGSGAIRWYLVYLKGGIEIWGGREDIRIQHPITRDQLMV